MLHTEAFDFHDVENRAQFSMPIHKSGDDGIILTANPLFAVTLCVTKHSGRFGECNQQTTKTPTRFTQGNNDFQIKNRRSTEFLGVGFLFYCRILQ